MLGFLGFGTTLACLDIFLKNQIEAQDDGRFPREMEGTDGKIQLYKNHNSGFSFGVLKNKPRVVELVPLCVTSGLFGAWCWLMGKRGYHAEKLAMTLVLSGGVSNLYDRLRRGYVVDYFSFQWRALKKIVFNLGDIFIFCGVGLTAVLELINRGK